MGLLCFASQIGCTVAGYLYPAYLSYKALQQQDTFMLQQLLVHWVVIGLYTVAEIIADIFLFWFPFYCQLKLFFVLWLVLPRTCGTMILYQNKILPFFRTNEGQIDETIRVLRSMAWTKLLDLAQIGYAHLHRLALEFLVTVGMQHPRRHRRRRCGLAWTACLSARERGAVECPPI
ncbi:TB2/DP1, HVA22 family-domain-containing protein [Polychytrium aggregatum]|uniref:TB2/DP1, HVA22 family-domain-containing protein n=1 Tax=Polychytrium aggregatum TaxID=110093 RepID=UPI0022FE20F1|nr:TB2/DP1, HVA22 family-domain-containing protein [Polychytrium aggregatum]KAI9209894.1 TB2/DP1, HVA22 family-domain-containing protein [Polychytrium aggregatum]